MKIEPLVLTPRPVMDTVADMLRNLKPGEALRVSTAQEYRSVHGQISRVIKERKIKFCSANDGDSDVIIFIKEQP